MDTANRHGDRGSRSASLTGRVSAAPESEHWRPSGRGLSRRPVPCTSVRRTTGGRRNGIDEDLLHGERAGH
ncbi:hypothetical protein [Kibdelosporangium philippinense]|uniref:hypothetical protein n=1 Tax=Kibdelosporangium philippinense TaxID=211113 RepID=UPI00361DF3ED